MKKTILFVAALLFVAAVYGQSVPRQKVVVEIATGTWCPFCPGASLGASDLQEFGHDVAVIKYHFNDAYTTPQSESRINYYGIGGYPTTIFDGVNVHSGGHQFLSIYEQFVPHYEERKAIPSPFSLSIEGGDSRDGTYEASVVVTRVDDFDGEEPVLHLAITETDIPQNWYGQTHVKDVLRLMVPDQFGTPLDFSGGDEQVIDLEFGLEAEWVTSNMHLVYFVQDVETQEIYQADIVALSELFDEFTLTFSVMESTGDEPAVIPIAGATVSLDGYDDQVTDDQGFAVFADIVPGEVLQYEVSKAGYVSETGTVETIEEDMLREVFLDRDGDHTVEFVVGDTFGNPVEDAVITFGEHQGAPGDYVFYHIPNGSYQYAVERTGYYTREGSVDVLEDLVLTVTLTPDGTPVTDPDQMEISLFPNPARDLLTIEAGERILDVQIIHINGQVIERHPANGFNVDVDAAALHPGVYIVRLRFEDQVATRRFTVVR